jgi:hypothetical protein
MSTLSYVGLALGAWCAANAALVYARARAAFRDRPAKRHGNER